MSKYLSNTNEGNSISVASPLSVDSNNQISISSSPSLSSSVKAKSFSTVGQSNITFNTTYKNLVTMTENQCGILMINSMWYSTFGAWYINFSNSPGICAAHLWTGSNMIAQFSGNTLQARTGTNSASMNWTYFRLQ